MKGSSVRGSIRTPRTVVAPRTGCSTSPSSRNATTRSSIPWSVVICRALLETEGCCPAPEGSFAQASGERCRAAPAGSTRPEDTRLVQELARTIRAPRGSQLRARSWQTEAALRMLMNNLDPDVAERPGDLVVYGGIGKAARDWPSFDRIVAQLERLGDDETLAIQSGKPVGVFRSHADAPRVVLANSNLVPRWATWEHFHELDRKGLMMYGQMTAGSWIYIGSQGIVEGTFETFADAGRRHFGGSLEGKVIVTGGLGGMGGAQPLAATMNSALFLGVEVDPARVEKRLKSGYCDKIAWSLDEALKLIDRARKDGQSISVGLVGNCANVLPEIVKRGVVPDVLTDQTSAHDALNGYVPHGMLLEDALALRAKNPNEYIDKSMHSMAVHVDAMLALQKKGAITFDYGNNIRAQAKKAGVENAFGIPGFVPEYIRPLLDRK